MRTPIWPHLTRASEDPGIREAAMRVRSLHRERARLFQAGGSPEEVERTARELDAAELALGRLSQTYAPQLQVRNANLQDLRADLGGLPVRGALLELRQFSLFDFRTRHWGSPHWAGVLVIGDGALRVRDLGPVADSQKPVEASLADPLGPAGQDAAAMLYRQLLQPFAAELAGIERLYVAPDGMLNLVSFGLLRDPTGEALLARTDVRPLQTGRDLLRPPERQPVKGLVAIGGIDFETGGSQENTVVKAKAAQQIAARQQSQGIMQPAALEQLRKATMACTGFGALPHSGDEVEEVARLYRHGRREESVQVVPGERGPQPTKSWLLALPPPRVLHLATHGFYCPDKVAADRPMLLAGVALAGANRMLREGGQDGILYALEAQDLNLEGTELVVLSACDTAQGRYDYGDGVAGLVRALRTAGARHVLVTLRPVGDESADRFMQRFYYHWVIKQAGTRSDPAAALRDAQSEHFGADESSQADQAWASFVMIGD
jgi:CHAT domain-containing protein